MNQEADETSPLVPVHEEAISAATPPVIREKTSVGTILFYSCLSIVAICGFVALVVNIFSGRDGGIPLSSDSEIPFSTTTHPLRPTSFWGDIQPPYPTGAWFTNLVLDSGDQPVVVLPYTSKITASGVGISFSAFRRQVSQQRITDVYDDDLTIGSTENYLSHYITRFDNLSVTIYHELHGASSFQTYLVKGSPYMTFEYLDATPTVLSKTSILTIDDQPIVVGDTVHGSVFKIGLSNWQTWLVYTSESVSFTVAEYSLTAMMPYSGVVRIAFLPQADSTECEYELTEHSSAYAKGGEVLFTVDGDTVYTQFIWDQYGSGDLLILALPHHIDTMDLSDVKLTLPSAYQTLKGRMTGVIGGTWKTVDDLTTVSFGLGDLEGGWGSDLDSDIRDALISDVNSQLPVNEDIYGFSKQCARMARLALIADDLDEDGYVDQALNIVEDALSSWLLNENSDLLVYDKTWGGVVTYNSLLDSSADYGNAWYNDHHFHYGYFIYAAAVLSKYRSDFYSANKLAIDYLVSDIACQASLSDKFPTARHKDFFDGHSWASGLFSEADGKSQESSSEAVNAYYAVYLMGEATDNADMRDYGRILLASEIRSVQRYWHMRNDSDIYDGIFAANRMVGVVGGLDVADVTWFGSNIEYVHGINLMPFLPISAELLSYDYMEEEWPVLAMAFNRTDDPIVPQWAGYLYMAYALLDPESAWDSILALTDFDTTNSKTNALHWVATRPEPIITYNVSAFAEDVEFEADYIPSSCLENSACFAQGLTLECCPTETGTFLGCCPVSPASMAEAECLSSPGCAALGLGADDPTELCCPTSSGVFLSCCEETSPTSTSTESPSSTSAACAAYSGCVGLDGDCCPTSAGGYLDCCYS